MDQKDYKILQLAAQSGAYRAAMKWSAELLSLTLPPVGSELRTQSLAVMHRKIAAAKADYAQMVFPELSAAESDLWAAAAQDAFDEASNEFMKIVQRE